MYKIGPTNIFLDSPDGFIGATTIKSYGRRLRGCADKTSFTDFLYYHSTPKILLAVKDRVFSILHAGDTDFNSVIFGISKRRYI